MGLERVLAFILGRRHVAIAAAVALAIVASACGGDAADVDDAAAAGGDGTQAAGSGEGGDEPVELLVWYDEDSAVPEDNFDAFHEDHPNITVTTDIVPVEELVQQLSRRAGAGEALPDVYRYDNELRATLYEAGLLRPITDMVERWEQEDPESFSQLPDAAWEAGRWDGEVLGLTQDAAMPLLWYRADLMRDAGIEVPWEPETWDEVLDMARQLKRAYPEIYPWAMRAKLAEDLRYERYHMTAAGVEWDDDIPQLDTEAGHHVIEFYQTLVREELVHPSVISWGSDEYRGAFIGGNAALMIESEGMIEDMEPADLAVGEDVIFGHLPLSRSGESNDITQTAAMKAMGLSADTEHPYEASLVLRYMSRPEIALEVAGDGIYRNDGLIETHRDELGEMYPGLDEFLDEYVQLGGEPTATSFYETDDVLERCKQDILSNPDAPAEELAARCMDELQSVKAEYE